MRGLALACLLLLIAPAVAQDAPLTHAYEIYLERLPAEPADRLIFIDMLTGETQTVRVRGERFTPLQTSVLYFDPARKQAMQVRPGAQPEPHPFITLPEEARRVDWLVDADRRRIVWTITSGPPESLRTVTRVARMDGSDAREILRDGPREDGLRALPVGFAGDSLIMDWHPDGLERYTAYTQYAALFRVDMDSDAPALLPGEPACFCGAGVRADQVLRLILAQDSPGFDLRVLSLNSDATTTIDGVGRPEFTQAGEILITPDGRQAVYALSDIKDFGAANQSVRTVFVLVDLSSNDQRLLTPQPITTYVHPVRWTDDGSTILMTSPQVNGTWKLNLADGQLIKIANAAYLGTLPAPVQA